MTARGRCAKAGVKFQDVQGHMCHCPPCWKNSREIWQSIEGNLKAQAELDDAFGDSSAVIKRFTATLTY